MLTRPKLMDPFQIVRISRLSKSKGTSVIRPAAVHPSLTTIGSC
jgi:hypothetical protein